MRTVCSTQPRPEKSRKNRKYNSGPILAECSMPRALLCVSQENSTNGSERSTLCHPSLSSSHYTHHIIPVCVCLGFRPNEAPQNKPKTPTRNEDRRKNVTFPRDGCEDTTCKTTSRSSSRRWAVACRRSWRLSRPRAPRSRFLQIWLRRRLAYPLGRTPTPLGTVSKHYRFA